MASVIGFIIFVVVARCLWTLALIGKTIYERTEEQAPAE